MAAAVESDAVGLAVVDRAARRRPRPDSQDPGEIRRAVGAEVHPVWEAVVVRPGGTGLEAPRHRGAERLPVASSPVGAAAACS